jgi:hypothetical protein
MHQVTKGVESEEASPNKNWRKIVQNSDEYYSENGILILEIVLETSLV